MKTILYIIMALPLVLPVLNWIVLTFVIAYVSLFNKDFKDKRGTFATITYALFFFMINISPVGFIILNIMSDDAYEKDSKLYRYCIYFEVWSLFFCVIALIILKTAY